MKFGVSLATFIIWFLITMHPLTIYAFYDTGRDSGNPMLSPSDLDSFDGKGGQFFVLYDNFKHPTGRYSQLPILFPNSDQFISMDYVDYSTPVYNVLQTRKTAKYSLSNLFYANLRLGLIKQEYEALQAKAHELLSEIKVPQKNTDRPALGGRKGYGIPASEKTEEQSLHEQLRALKRESNAITQYTLPKSRINNDGKNKAVRQLSSSAYRIDSSRSRRLNENTDPSTIASSSYQGGKNPGGVRVSQSHSRRSIRSSRVPDEPLPIIFALPVDIIQYLLSNKVEALIYGSILFFLVAIATSIRPRGNARSE